MHAPRSLVVAAIAGAGALAVAVPALAKTTAHETLSSFKITGASSANAGKVTFAVKNSATIGHEMVVLKTNTAAGKLKVTGGKVSEKSSVGEVEVGAGQSKSVTLNLKKGHYVLVCNIQGHYMDGMHKDFTVK